MKNWRYFYQYLALFTAICSRLSAIQRQIT